MRHLSSLAFVLIMLVVVFPSCKKGGGLFGKKKKVDMTSILLARQDSIRVADSIRRAQEALLAIEMARQDSIRVAEEAKLVNKYHIIVGSFITPEYAKNFAEEYKSKGYNVRILQMAGGRFELVSAESFDSFRPAVNKLSEYQENIVSDAWLYIDK
jgi:hypothetical protein